MVAPRVEFVGYGIDAPAAGQMDYRGKDVKDAAVVFLGANGPKTVDAGTYRQILTGRSRYADRPAGSHRQHRCGRRPPAAESRTVAAGAVADAAAAGGTRRSISRRRAASISRLRQTSPASDEFLTFLFSRAPVGLRRAETKAAAQEPLPSFRLNDVTLTFDVDVDYEIVRTQLTQNVVGIVEGSDPRLKDTYVAVGAHYDHIGYAERAAAPGNERPPGAPGRVTAGTGDDHIWNGADDNGSGTVALMALAQGVSRGHRRRSGRCSSSGTPARKPGCTARATSPTIRPCRSTRSSRS